MLILVLIVLILWSLGWSLRPRLSAALASEPKSIRANELSLIIPARNEAHNLPRLLNSIRDQAKPPLEVLVVDDGSTDGTADVAAKHGARVIPSQPLPDGWRGKTWACHQGAQAATGSHLCFLDADTWFEPEGLERVLQHYRKGALSVGPWHAIEKPWESLSLFFNLAMVAGTVPHGLFGQVLLVDHDSYQRVGGHEAVKSKVLENVHLKQGFDAANIPTTSLPGRGMLNFRMYPNGIGEMIEGWTKGFASGANRAGKASLITMVLWMTGLMTVVIALALSEQIILWAALYAIHAIQVAWLGRKVGAFPWYAGLLYPLPLMFFFILFARSAGKGGRNVTWKGRHIDAS